MVNLQHEAEEAAALGAACLAKAASATEFSIKAINATDAARHYAVAQRLAELAFAQWAEATAEALHKAGEIGIVLDQEVWQEALDAGMTPEEAARYIAEHAGTDADGESGRG